MAAVVVDVAGKVAAAADGPPHLTTPEVYTGTPPQLTVVLAGAVGCAAHDSCGAGCYYYWRVGCSK